MREAFRDALSRRLKGRDLLVCLRGPVFVIQSLAAVLLLTGVLSGSFAQTQRLIDSAYSLQRLPQASGYDPRGDRLVAYLSPIVLAMASGVALLFICRRSLGTFGWRCWVFFILKVLLVWITLPLCWIEGGAAIRAMFSTEGGRLLIGGLLLALAFVAGFGAATIWIIQDQRRRCPVCLRRLTLPVSIGSWASLFDPPVTELVCESGHGMLARAETESSGASRWIVLDGSWRNLFETSTFPAGKKL